MTALIRVLLVDDQILLRRSLATILSSSPDIEVVGECSRGEEVAPAARSLKPDVILMDIRMPGDVDGVEATRQICSDPNLKNIRVCVLTVFEDDEHVLRAIQAGAIGYILKDTPPDSVIKAVHAVHVGHTLLSPGVLTSVLPQVSSGITVKPSLVDNLTARQTEVLQLVASGLSNDEIEKYLSISHSTMKSHMSALLKHLAARDRAQLVVIAYESGIVRPGP